MYIVSGTLGNPSAVGGEIQGEMCRGRRIARKQALNARQWRWRVRQGDKYCQCVEVQRQGKMWDTPALHLMPCHHMAVIRAVTAVT